MIIPKPGDYSLADVMPAALGRAQRLEAPLDILSRPPGAVVMIVIDGLGWDQLDDRLELAPTLASLTGGPINTVVPSTTATALTSLTTGLAPSEHGVLGYRMIIDGEVFNTLRWSTTTWPDARRMIPADSIQTFEPFLGDRVSVITRAEFTKSGFTQAHLRGGRLDNYRTTSALVQKAATLARDGEAVTYCYYDGIDKVAHEYGLGEVYDRELRFVDRLVADVIDAVPTGTTVIVTADHGQVDCGDRLIRIDRDVSDCINAMSGEGRFRWLHAKPGQSDELLAAAEACHGDQAWVRSVEQIVDENWFGRFMSPSHRARLGDVALVASKPVAFDDPADTGPFSLIGRHGSVTRQEMLVPLLGVVV